MTNQQRQYLDHMNKEHFDEPLNEPESKVSVIFLPETGKELTSGRWIDTLQKDKFGIEYKTARSAANVPYVEPTQIKTFLVKVRKNDGKGDPIAGTSITRSVQSTSFTAARELVVSKGFALAD